MDILVHLQFLSVYQKDGDKIEIGYAQIKHLWYTWMMWQGHKYFCLNIPMQKGRNKFSACMATLEEVIQVISAIYPQLQAPSIDSLGERNGMMKLPDLSSKKLMDAGFQFKYGLKEMLVDAIECCKEKGYWKLAAQFN